MKITVRKEQIENSRRKDSHHCMIADAIHEHVPWAKYISVDVQAIKFSDVDAKTRFIFLTPPVAQNAILRWDRGIEIQPFSFLLVDPVIKKVRKRWTGNPEVLKKARTKYEKTSRRKKVDPMAPRLVTKKKPKVSRFREFGIRKYTQE